MVSSEARTLIAEMWAEYDVPEPPLEESRQQWIEWAEKEPLPEGTKIEPMELGGVFCERISVGAVLEDAVCLLPHGGGYVAGNCVTHRKMAAHFSMRTGLAVVLPDYRLAPEHPFPAGLNDTLAVYGALREGGIKPKRIILLGDSAGGGMALALMLALRDGEQELPRAAILLSPWTDIEAKLPSYEMNRSVDPSIAPEDLRVCGEQYVGSESPINPYISPVHADLTGLPPTYIQVGALEVMLDDSVVLTKRARQFGVKCDLEVWPGLWHVWQSNVPSLPEANEAMDKIGAYARKALGISG